MLPRAIRQNQAFGGAPSTSTTNPGIVLPVYICSAGVNCATAADRATQPEQPLSPPPTLADPANGAARIYYLFGDVKAGSERTNELYRITGGLRGTIADAWNWNVDVGYSRDNLESDPDGIRQSQRAGAGDQHRLLQLRQSEPELAGRPRLRAAARHLALEFERVNGRCVDRAQPVRAAGRRRSVAIGGQYRKEKLTNRSANPNLDIPGLSTAQAFGDRDVKAAYFEIDAPILDALNVNVSGRYDHYSEGFSRFSPKVSVEVHPDPGDLASRFLFGRLPRPDLRRNRPAQLFLGLRWLHRPNADFRAAHPTNAGYTANYSIGRGYVGNPDIKPETSRSFTWARSFEPTPLAELHRRLLQREEVEPDHGRVARRVRQSMRTTRCRTRPSLLQRRPRPPVVLASRPSAPGYSCNVIDGADPFALNALPRLLVLNAPYVNVNYDVTSGLQFTGSVNVPITE